MCKHATNPFAENLSHVPGCNNSSPVFKLQFYVSTQFISDMCQSKMLPFHRLFSPMSVHHCTVCILLIQQILASSILRCTALFPTDPSPNIRCAVCPTHVSLLSFLSPSLFIHILSRFPLLSTYTHHQSQFTCFTLSNSLVMIRRGSCGKTAETPLVLLPTVSLFRLLSVSLRNYFSFSNTFIEITSF